MNDISAFYTTEIIETKIGEGPTCFFGTASPFQQFPYLKLQETHSVLSFKVDDSGGKFGGYRISILIRTDS